MINLIDMIRQKYYRYKYPEYYLEWDDNTKLIWGLKSYDDLSGQAVSLHTLNDIDITYDDDNKKYSLSLETIYQFENGREGESLFLQSLLEKFDNWMIENQYNREISPTQFVKIAFGLCEGTSYYIEEDSIEKLYADFKWSVDEFYNRNNN